MSQAASEGTASRGSIAALVVALLLAAVAIWEIVATRLATRSVPDDAAWARAAAHVRSQHRPGDLIVFAPSWIDPVGRLHLGDLMPIDMVARMDAARYARIWELAIRDARAPDTAGLSPVETRDFDGVSVRRYERTPVTVLADVRERLATARTSGAVARPPTLELAEVGFTPRRCIQVAPIARKQMRVTFPDVPAGTLVGYMGIADVFTRREQRAPATLAVEAGGRVVATARAGVDDGWVRFSAPVPAGEVTFVASSAAHNRLICFAAEVRK